MTLRLISFGYLHLSDGQPPDADHVEDVRCRLYDPAGYHQVLALLQDGPVDGRDPRVRDIVLANPGAGAVLADLTARARTPGITTIAVGCGQGHDRSVALVETLAATLRYGGPVLVEHCHIDRPRIRP